MSVQRLSVRDELLVRYLLGDLSPEDAARLEESYFDDDEAFEQLLGVEDELLHAYARGELAERERERFEARYLSHPRGRERAAFARSFVRALAPAADTAATEGAAGQRDVRPGPPPSRWRAMLPAYFAARPAAAFSLVALLLLALVAASVWLAAEWRERSLIEAERATERGERKPQPVPEATPSR